MLGSYVELFVKSNLLWMRALRQTCLLRAYGVLDAALHLAAALARSLSAFADHLPFPRVICDSAHCFLISALDPIGARGTS